MSGGSFNYLYCKDAENSFQYLDDMKRIADELTVYGYAHDAEKKTRELIAFIERTMAKIQDQMNNLHEVLEAVEFHCSGDWSEEAVQKAIERYRTT